MRSLAIVVLKLVALAAVLYLAAFYFRLGFFLPVVFAGGAVVALVATARQWRATRAPWAAAAGVLPVYGALQLLAFIGATSEAVETFPMTWSITSDGDSAAPEVVLRFVDFPDHLVGLYSREVADHLGATVDGSVDVSFSVTRDLGCFRGFHETRIGSLTSWSASAGGYAGSVGRGPPPWADPWWCP